MVIHVYIHIKYTVIKANRPANNSVLISNYSTQVHYYNGHSNQISYYSQFSFNELICTSITKFRFTCKHNV